MKGKFVAGASALALTVSSAFAEGSGSNYIDLSELTDVATEMGSEIKALFTGDILTAVSTILGGIVVVWGLTILWRWIRRIAGR